MSARAFKPGDVAMVTKQDGATLPAVRTQDHKGNQLWVAIGTDHWITDGPSITARPLVVIDPEDREQVERLASVHKWMGTNANVVGDLADALREFATPKPRVCPAVLVIGGERIECERDPGHVTDHRNDSIGQGVRWSA